MAKMRDANSRIVIVFDPHEASAEDRRPAEGRQGPSRVVRASFLKPNSDAESRPEALVPVSYGHFGHPGSFGDVLLRLAFAFQCAGDV